MRFARDKVKALVEAPSYRIPDLKCLECGKEMDVAMPTGGGRRPEPNDVAVCAYCGCLQAYGDDMKFRELNDAEILECAGDEDILLAQAFARDFREFKG
jgi:hypothetical protein